MPRPNHRLTPALQREIVESLESGLFRRAAAALVGIPETTFSRWYHQGATEERGKYADFFVAVNGAEATFQKNATDMIRASSSKNPKVLMWLLSRRFPHEFSRHDNVEPVRPDDSAENSKALRSLLIERLERLFPEPTPAEAPPPPVEAPAGG